MRRTLWRQPVDRLPVQTNYTPVMSRKLEAAFGVSPAELPNRLDNHLLRLDLTHPKRLGVNALREISLPQFDACVGELPAEVAKRCRFILEENARVLKMAEALQDFDHQAIRQLTAESFQGACELYEISAPTMHAMMRAMLAAPGVIGARQAGAGFGGCMVAFVEMSRMKEFSDAVRVDYLANTGIEAEIYPVAAAAGAGMI